jgi:hypothetical protein
MPQLPLLAPASFETFWKWFIENEEVLFDFEQDQETVFEALADALHLVNEQLTFEFGRQEDGCREFVISADGNRESFPFVVGLADAAPKLKRWRVTKFRPRRSLDFDLTFDNERLSPRDLLFSIEPDNGLAGLTLFMRGLNERNHRTYLGVAFLFLDHALGEYDVETKVGYIDVQPMEAESSLPKHAFTEIPVVFDRFMARYSN